MQQYMQQKLMLHCCVIIFDKGAWQESDIQWKFTFTAVSDVKSTSKQVKDNR